MTERTPDQEERDRVQRQILDLLRQAANPAGRTGERVVNRIITMVSGSLFERLAPANIGGNAQNNKGLLQGPMLNRWYEKIATFFGDKNGNLGTITGRHTFQYDEMDENGVEQRRSKTVDRKQDMAAFIEDLRDAGRTVSNVKYTGQEVSDPMTPLTRAMEAFADWMGIAKSNPEPPTKGEDNVTEACNALEEAVRENTDARNGQDPSQPDSDRTNTPLSGRKSTGSPLLDMLSEKLNVPVATLQRFGQAVGVAAPPMIAAFIGIKVAYWGITALGKSLKKLADEAWITTQKLAHYNGMLAYGAAMLDQKRQLRDIAHAGAIAEGGLFGGAERFKAQDRWEQAIQPLKEQASILGNDVAILVLTQITAIVTTLNTMIATQLQLGAQIIDVLAFDPTDAILNPADLIARPMKNKAQALLGKNQNNNALWPGWDAAVAQDNADMAARMKGPRLPGGAIQ